MADVVTRLQADIKTALKAGERERTEVLRLVLAAVKQKQIDSGETVDDAGLIGIVDKMIKQRRDSIKHFESAGRDDLRAREQAEIDLLQPFLPQAMNEDELRAAIEEVIQKSGASGIKDMGKIMALLKPRLAGRADMGQVSKTVKQCLQGGG